MAGCTPEAMRAQGALSEFMRAPRTTEPPTPDRGSVTVEILILKFGPTYSYGFFLGGV
jgi:hypothetical protein